MDNNTDNNQLKWILKEGLHAIPTEDFNERVIQKYLSEQKQSELAPSSNSSLLLILLALISFPAVLMYHFKSVAFTILPKISASAIPFDKLYIGMFAVTVFMLFSVFCNFIEEKKMVKVLSQ